MASASKPVRFASLQAAMKNYVEEPELAKEQGEKSYRLFCEEFTPEKKCRTAD